MEKLTFARALLLRSDNEPVRRDTSRDDDSGELRTLTELELGLAAGGDDVPTWNGH